MDDVCEGEGEGEITYTIQTWLAIGNEGIGLIRTGMEGEVKEQS